MAAARGRVRRKVMTHRSVPHSARRRVGSAVLAGLLLLGGASAVAADEPSPPLGADDLGLDGHASYVERVARPAATVVITQPAAPASPGPQPTTQPSPTAVPAPEPDPVGVDISYPQCGGPFPETFGFAVVGVNGGRVYSENPCLGTGDGPSQLVWAGRETQLYVNTGNPGPRDSLHWPVGQTEPRICDPGDVDSLDCAYDYGWNAAHHAHDIVEAAWTDVGWTDADTEALPDDLTWWLDVEDANSWRPDDARNIAALHGMVDALTELGVGEIGFYSTPRLWFRITGGTDAFGEFPAWHAGAADEADAAQRCDEEAAFTGGELRMVQWVHEGIDRNLLCDA